MIFSDDYRTIFSIPADKPITIYSPYVPGLAEPNNLPGRMNDVFICDACAMMWSQHRNDGYGQYTPYDHFADENCNPQCKNCLQHLDEHLDDKCLFGPGKLDTKRYIITWEGK